MQHWVVEEEGELLHLEEVEAAMQMSKLRVDQEHRLLGLLELHSIVDTKQHNYID